MTRLRQAFLFLFGASVAGFIGADLPPTTVGHIERDLVFFLAMYPFAASVGFPIRAYWLLLVTVMPVALALRFYAGPTAPFFQAGAAILFGVSLVVLATRAIRRMRER